MTEPTMLVAKPSNSDSLWAVIAWIGQNRRVAEVFPSRSKALADLEWRERQVSAYAGSLLSGKAPVPRYLVAPIRRSDLPRRWVPMPALGFLRG